MSKFEEVTLEELINLTTEEIKKNLNYVVSESSIKNFKRLNKFPAFAITFAIFLLLLNYGYRFLKHH